MHWNTNYYPDKASKNIHLIPKCDKRSQLVDIDVVAGKETVEGTIFGYTPMLMINLNMCYWKQNCIITFPRDAMFSCVSINMTEGSSAIVRPNDEISEASCFLKKAEFLRPISAKCVKNKCKIFNIK